MNVAVFSFFLLTLFVDATCVGVFMVRVVFLVVVVVWVVVNRGDHLDFQRVHIGLVQILQVGGGKKECDGGFAVVMGVLPLMAVVAVVIRMVVDIQMLFFVMVVVGVLALIVVMFVALVAVVK